MDKEDEEIEKERKEMEDKEMNMELGEILDVVEEEKRYFEGKEKWEMRKKDNERMGKVIYVKEEVMRRVGIMVKNLIKKYEEKMIDIMDVKDEKRKFEDVMERKIDGGKDMNEKKKVLKRYVEEEEKK